jgi:hypothetical protein
MKQFLVVLGVAFWVGGEPAYAQSAPYYYYGFQTPSGVPFAYSQPYPYVSPYSPGPSPYLPGQHTVFQSFYDPVCHYAPGVWGWRQECF